MTELLKLLAKKVRVSAISPAVLLDVLGKGIDPGELAQRGPVLLGAFAANQPHSGLPAGAGKALDALRSPKALEALDRSRAALVVRSLNALEWIFFVLSALVVLAWALFSLIALLGTHEVVTTVNGAEQKARAQAAIVGFSSIGGLLSGISIFLVGILCWWAEAMLKGLYEFARKN